MKTGLYDDLTSLEYHTGPGVSKSGLDAIRRSPLHYWHEYGQRQPAPEDATGEDLVDDGEADWAVIGRALHAAVLEPDTFVRRFAIQPSFGRTKVDIEAKRVWRAAHQGKGILHERHAPLVAGMRKALASHQIAGRLLDPSVGRAERSAYWIDPATGVLCRCRPDFLRDDGIVVDLKTARDASPDAFRRACANERYHVQAAFYADGLRAVGVHVRGFVFVVVEKTAPYAVGVYTLDGDSVLEGATEYAEDLAVYARCQRSGRWPGYTEQVHTLRLPEWRIRKE